MAESLLKRQRDDASAAVESDESSKRQKNQSYNQIISILEEEEDVSNQDLSDMFKTLQEELSSASDSNSFSPLDPLQSCASSSFDEAGGGVAASESSSPFSKDEDEEGAGINVMRHLLEASDDELGLPSISESGDEENSGENLFNLGDGMWEFEDDAANYYTLLQCELFL